MALICSAQAKRIQGEIGWGEGEALHGPGGHPHIASGFCHWLPVAHLEPEQKAKPPALLAEPPVSHPSMELLFAGQLPNNVLPM